MDGLCNWADAAPPRQAACSTTGLQKWQEPKQKAVQLVQRPQHPAQALAVAHHLFRVSCMNGSVSSILGHLDPSPLRLGSGFASPLSRLESLGERTAIGNGERLWIPDGGAGTRREERGGSGVPPQEFRRGMALFSDGGLGAAGSVRAGRIAGGPSCWPGDAKALSDRGHVGGAAALRRCGRTLGRAS